MNTVPIIWTKDHGREPAMNIQGIFLLQTIWIKEASHNHNYPQEHSD
jgi:hypothetical protein